MENNTNEKGLQYLIEKQDQNLQDLQWLKNQVAEYRKEAKEALNLNQLEITQANVGRLIDYYTELKTESEYENRQLLMIPKETYLKVLNSGLDQLSGVLKMIEARKPYLRKRPQQQKTEPKPYKNKDRAYGYFMAMAMQNGKINIAPNQKTEPYPRSTTTAPQQRVVTDPHAIELQIGCRKTRLPPASSLPLCAHKRFPAIHETAPVIVPD